MSLFALEFRDTVTLGSGLVAILVGLVGFAILAYGARWKAAYTTAAANASAWEENAKAWEETARRLEKQVESLKVEVNNLRGRVAELEALPDVNAVHARLIDHDERVAAALALHDTHAEVRADRIVEAIKQIGQQIR